MSEFIMHFNSEESDDLLAKARTLLNVVIQKAEEQKMQLRDSKSLEKKQKIFNDNLPSESVNKQDSGYATSDSNESASSCQRIGVSPKNIVNDASSENISNSVSPENIPNSVSHETIPNGVFSETNNRINEHYRNKGLILTDDAKDCKNVFSEITAEMLDDHVGDSDTDKDPEIIHVVLCDAEAVSSDAKINDRTKNEESFNISSKRDSILSTDYKISSKKTNACSKNEELLNLSPAKDHSSISSEYLSTYSEVTCKKIDACSKTEFPDISAKKDYYSQSSNRLSTVPEITSKKIYACSEKDEDLKLYLNKCHSLSSDIMSTDSEITLKKTNACSKTEFPTLSPKKHHSLSSGILSTDSEITSKKINASKTNGLNLSPEKDCSSPRCKKHKDGQIMKTLKYISSKIDCLHPFHANPTPSNAKKAKSELDNYNTAVETDSEQELSSVVIIYIKKEDGTLDNFSEMDQGKVAAALDYIKKGKDMLLDAVTIKQGQTSVRECTKHQEDVLANISKKEQKLASTVIISSENEYILLHDNKEHAPAVSAVVGHIEKEDDMLIDASGSEQKPSPTVILSSGNEYMLVDVPSTQRQTPPVIDYSEKDGDLLDDSSKSEQKRVSPVVGYAETDCDMLVDDSSTDQAEASPVIYYIEKDGTISVDVSKMEPQQASPVTDYVDKNGSILYSETKHKQASLVTGYNENYSKQKETSVLKTFSVKDDSTSAVVSETEPQHGSVVSDYIEQEYDIFVNKSNNQQRQTLTVIDSTEKLGKISDGSSKTEQEASVARDCIKHELDVLVNASNNRQSRALPVIEKGGFITIGSSKTDPQQAPVVRGYTKQDNGVLVDASNNRQSQVLPDCIGEDFDISEQQVTDFIKQDDGALDDASNNRQSQALPVVDSIGEDLDISEQQVTDFIKQEDGVLVDDSNTEQEQTSAVIIYIQNEDGNVEILPGNELFSVNENNEPVTSCVKEQHGTESVKSHVLHPNEYASELDPDCGLVDDVELCHPEISDGLGEEKVEISLDYDDGGEGGGGDDTSIPFKYDPMDILSSLGFTLSELSCDDGKVTCSSDGSESTISQSFDDKHCKDIAKLFQQVSNSSVSYELNIDASKSTVSPCFDDNHSKDITDLEKVSYSVGNHNALNADVHTDVKCVGQVLDSSVCLDELNDVKRVIQDKANTDCTDDSFESEKESDNHIISTNDDNDVLKRKTIRGDTNDSKKLRNGALEIHGDSFASAKQTTDASVKETKDSPSKCHSCVVCGTQFNSSVAYVSHIKSHYTVIQPSETETGENENPDQKPNTMGVRKQAKDSIDNIQNVLSTDKDQNILDSPSSKILDPGLKLAPTKVIVSQTVASETEQSKNLLCEAEEHQNTIATSPKSASSSGCEEKLISSYKKDIEESRYRKVKCRDTVSDELQGSQIKCARLSEYGKEFNEDSDIMDTEVLLHGKEKSKNTVEDEPSLSNELEVSKIKSARPSEFNEDSDTVDTEVLRHGKEKSKNTVEDEPCLSDELNENNDVEIIDLAMECWTCDSPEEDLITTDAEEAVDPLTTKKTFLSNAEKNKPGDPEKQLGVSKKHECFVCSEKFQSRAKLHKHYLIHDGVKPFKCKFCGEHFKLKTHLKDHYIDHKALRNVMCEMCGKIFLYEKQLIFHQSTNTNTCRLICPICHKVFSRSNDLKKHTLAHHTEEHERKRHQRMICEICGKIFLYKKKLLNHLRAHRRRFCCPVCHKNLSNSDSLKRHVWIHTREKLYRCTMCSESFALMKDLKVHELVHNDVHFFPCKECEESFKQSSTRLTQDPVKPLNHLSTLKSSTRLTQDPVKPLKQLSTLKSSTRLTQDPVKSLNQLSSLKSNTRQNHNPYKSVLCKVCNKHFSCSHVLKRHQTIHDKSRPFECDVCHKRFIHDRHLMDHKKIHTNPKPFRCDICFKRFSTSSTIRAHLVTHVDDKPFKCSFCDRSYCTKNSLKHHEKKHVHAYACRVCGKYFTTVYILRDHLCKVE